MFDRNNWIWFLLAILLLALVLAVPVGGRKENHPAAVAPGEKTFSGTVEAVNQHTCEICKCVELTVTLKTGGSRLEVRLGPKTFFEEHDLYLSRGDSIEVTGIRFMERGRDVVLANELRRGGETLVLRGKYGRPAWLEAHGHTCPVCGN